MIRPSLIRRSSTASCCCARPCHRRRSWPGCTRSRPARPRPQCRDRPLATPPDRPDLIAIEDLVLDDPALTLPHPEMHKRELGPGALCEVSADWRHPILGLSAAECWRGCGPLKRSPRARATGGASGRRRARNCAALDVMRADQGGHLSPRRRTRELRQGIALQPRALRKSLARDADHNRYRRQLRHKLLEASQHLPAVAGSRLRNAPSRVQPSNPRQGSRASSATSTLAISRSPTSLITSR